MVARGIFKGSGEGKFAVFKKKYNFVNDIVEIRMLVIFDKQKSLNCLLYIANRLKIKDFHKIFKVLYFAERQHLADWGRVITGDVFIAMDAGPVPSKLYDMLKIVRGDSYISDTEGLGKYFQIENWMFVRPLKDANLDQLSKSEQDALNSSIEKYGSLSFDELKKKSHDIAWSSTAKDFAISWDDIAREVGLDSDEIDYLTEYSRFQKSLN